MWYINKANKATYYNQAKDFFRHKYSDWTKYELENQKGAYNFRIQFILTYKRREKLIFSISTPWAPTDSSLEGNPPKIGVNITGFLLTNACPSYFRYGILFWIWRKSVKMATSRAQIHTYINMQSFEKKPHKTSSGTRIGAIISWSREWIFPS